MCLCEFSDNGEGVKEEESQVREKGRMWELDGWGSNSKVHSWVLGLRT